VLSSPKSAASLLPFARHLPKGVLRVVIGGGWTVAKSGEEDDGYFVAKSSKAVVEHPNLSPSTIAVGGGKLFVNSSDGWTVFLPNGKRRRLPKAIGVCWDDNLGPIFYTWSENDQEPRTTLPDLAGNVRLKLNERVFVACTDVKSGYVLGIREWRHFGGDLCEWRRGGRRRILNAVDDLISRRWDFYW